MNRKEMNIKSTLPERCCLSCKHYRYERGYPQFCILIDEGFIQNRYIDDSDVCDYFEKVEV